MIRKSLIHVVVLCLLIAAVTAKKKDCTKRVKKNRCVDGGWGEFGAWSKCSVPCGGGTQIRTRTCTNPTPANDGKECEGACASARICNKQDCSVDGGWSEFGAWSTCTKSCAGGTQIQTRTCTNPVPDNGGKECEGAATSEQICNTKACPVKCVHWTSHNCDSDTGCTYGCNGGTCWRQCGVCSSSGDWCWVDGTCSTDDDCSYGGSCTATCGGSG